MNSDYDRFHQSRINLLIHIVAVPLFVISLVLALRAIFLGEMLVSMLLFLAPLLSLAAQGYGHKLEAVPPEPFKGAGDFVRRILSEQFFRFWTFVLSGGWFKALKSSETQRTT